MGSVCKGAHQDTQGGGVDIGACVGSRDPSDPFSQHAACVVDAVGLDNPPQIGGELPGVPMGVECGLTDGGGGGTPAKPKEEPKAPAAKNDKPWYQAVLDTFSPTLTATTSTGARTSTPSAPPSTPAAQVRPLAEGDSYEIGNPKASVQATELRDAKTGELVKFSVTVKGSFDDAIKLLTQDALNAKSSSSDISAIVLEEVKRMRSGGQACLDPLDCANDCTAIGEVISEVQACLDDLLGDIAKALGLPDKRALVRKVDIASYPTPDAPVIPTPAPARASRAVTATRAASTRTAAWSSATTDTRRREAPTAAAVAVSPARASSA